MGNTLHIYTASAGSGKTHTIAREFLRLALTQVGNYRHIQAVTFTNKATEEMKSRILDKLHDLSQDKDQSLAKELCKQLNISTEALQLKAQSCLRAILLDYGSFRISTIDSFFQEVLRSFARELNLPASFRLELDNKTTLKTAATALFAESHRGDNQEIIEWIREISINNIHQGKNYNPLTTIEALSEELHREEVRAIKGFPSITQVRYLRDTLQAQHNAFALECQALASKVNTLLQDIVQAGYRFSSRGAGFYFEEISMGKFPEGSELLPKALLNAQDNPSTIFLSSDKKKIEQRFSLEAIAPLITEYIDFINQGLTAHLDREQILAQVYSLGLLSAIEAKVRELQRSNNYILLADAPSLIHQILSDEGGVPFLYERIGSHIRHHMIDEFQDTSQMQYENFLPLLEESLSSGTSQRRQDSLIVGDVKQSIYRFRGSDSRQLKRLTTDTAFPFDRAIHNLKINWRSCPEIIQFNNQLYQNLPNAEQASLPQIIQNHYIRWINSLPLPPQTKEQLCQEASIFTSNYSEANQQEQKSWKGAVVIHDCVYEKLGADVHSDNAKEKNLESNEEASEQDDKYNKLSYQLPQLICHLYERGFRPCDIAILVCDKHEASAIADILQNAPNKPKEGFDFISAEALKPTEAIAVNCVIAALGHIVKPQDKSEQEQLCSLYTQLCGKELCPERMQRLSKLGHRSLYETLEAIIAEFKEDISLGEMPHLIKLLDTALGYQQDLSLDINDFLAMWQDKGGTLRLSLPADENKLHLMTIHKSKGLDFPVVLLPYLNWELLSKDNPTLWCSNPYAELTGIGLVPIKMSNQLQNTSFAPDYIREHIQSSLDALNLLYVATTRAEQEMHLWITDAESLPKGKSYYSCLSGTDMPKHILPLLNEIFGSKSIPHLRIPLNGEEIRHKEYRHLPRKHSSAQDTERADTQRLHISTIESYPLGNRIEELREGLSYFVEGRKRHFGSVMHQILSRMQTFQDVDMVREEVFSRGDLLPEERSIALEHLEHLLNETQAQAWFDGSGVVRNEMTIFGSDTGSYRPDRIITYPDGSAVVVDYKFGQEDKSYKDQVMNYADLLRAMGYSPVDAYLWYLVNTDADTGQTVRSRVQHIGRL